MSGQKAALMLGTAGLAGIALRDVARGDALADLDQTRYTKRLPDDRRVLRRRPGS